MSALDDLMAALELYFIPKGIDVEYTPNEMGSSNRIGVFPGNGGGVMGTAPFDPRQNTVVPKGVFSAVYENFTLKLYARDAQEQLNKQKQHNATRELYDLLVFCIHKSAISVIIDSATWESSTAVNQWGSVLIVQLRCLTLISPPENEGDIAVFPWTALVRTHIPDDNPEHEDITVPNLV